MNRSLAWRGGIIAAVMIGALMVAWPVKDKINLGLDLRGGIYLMLRVETSDALKAESDKDLDRLIQEARDGGVTSASGSRTSDSSFELTGVEPTSDTAIAGIVDDYLPTWDWRRTGDRLVFDMTAANRTEIERLAIVQALETIRNRIDAFGVAEPVIQRLGLDSDRIVVQLPGVDDPERVKRLIKNTAFLEFRLVDFPLGGRGASTREEILANYGGQLPDQLEILTEDIRDDQLRVVAQRFYAVEGRPAITGRDLKGARPGLGEFSQPVVNFSLTHEGGQKFGEVTGANVGRGLAIVLDGKVASAPNINSRITDSGIIEGNFTQQEVEDLSTVLRSGALPAGIVYLEERTIGPSLGQDSIRKGLRAGLTGAALMVLAMFIVYRLTGLNAIVALTFNIILILGALAYVGATLTLPGIAGIVLTIGMAVDANVLVFERIREELNAGRTVKSAIDNGFKKALSSILDANATTLIAALFLFQFGTGPIRGFAVTLSAGILASLGTAILVSRWLFDVILAGKTRVDRLSI